jgi:signal transduction histidine kinase
MSIAELAQRFNHWQTQRSQHMLPAAALRADMFRGILMVAVIAMALLAAFMSWDGVSILWFRFIIVQSGLWLAVAALRHRRRMPSSAGSLFARAALFAAVVEMATLPSVRYAYPEFGGLIVLTIILAGLLVSRMFVLAWALGACAMHISQLPYLYFDWSAYAGWCMVYSLTGALVTLFARHFERFYEASRTAEEQQRSAIIAERMRFARDIHDTLAQGFTGIMMQLNAAEQRLQDNPEQARLHIQRARNLAGESIEEAQQSILALRNVALVSGSLLSAIEQIGHKLTADSGVRLESRLEGAPYSLPEQHEANLLRIAQEALTNAVRHAGAGTIEVLLAYRTGSVLLEIGDSGRGMNTAGHSSGFGIEGMEKRAEQIGGEFKMMTGPGRGTRVIVTVPGA